MIKFKLLKFICENYKEKLIKKGVSQDTIDYLESIPQSDRGKLISRLMANPLLTQDDLKVKEKFTLDNTEHKRVLDADPTPKKDYYNIIAHWAGWIPSRDYELAGIPKEYYEMETVIRLPEDAERVKEVLSYYNQNKGKFKTKHVYKYHHFQDLEQEYLEVSNQKSKNQTIRDIKMQGATKIIDNSDWRVYEITTVEAACYYGAGTRWCTASKTNNMASYYMRNGPLYIFIDKKTDEKYQATEDFKQVMDAADYPVEASLKNKLINILLEEYGITNRVTPASRDSISDLIHEEFAVISPKVQEYFLKTFPYDKKKHRTTYYYDLLKNYRVRPVEPKILDIIMDKMAQHTPLEYLQWIQYRENNYQIDKQHEETVFETLANTQDFSPSSIEFLEGYMYEYVRKNRKSIPIIEKITNRPNGVFFHFIRTVSLPYYYFMNEKLPTQHHERIRKWKDKTEIMISYLMRYANQDHEPEINTMREFRNFIRSLETRETPDLGMSSRLHDFEDRVFVKKERSLMLESGDWFYHMHRYIKLQNTPQDKKDVRERLYNYVTEEFKRSNRYVIHAYMDYLEHEFFYDTDNEPLEEEFIEYILDLDALQKMSDLDQWINIIYAVAAKRSPKTSQFMHETLIKSIVSDNSQTLVKNRVIEPRVANNLLSRLITNGIKIKNLNFFKNITDDRLLNDPEQAKKAMHSYLSVDIYNYYHNMFLVYDEKLPFVKIHEFMMNEANNTTKAAHPSALLYKMSVERYP